MTTKIELNEEEIDAIVTSLSMRCSIIETGTYTLRANDAKEQGCPEKIRKLAQSQKEVLALMDKLRHRLEKSL